MKNLLVAVSTAAFLASQGVAGGLDEPVVDAVDVAAAPATSAAWIIPLVAVALVALAVSGSDDDDDEEEVLLDEEEEESDGEEDESSDDESDELLR
ncbi:MAG: hypothetical protein AAF198_02125 [Pseudomonadota bacterium]